MSGNMAQLTSLRTTKVVLTDLGEAGDKNEPIVLNIQHIRLTPIVNEQLAGIIVACSELEMNYWSEQMKKMERKSKEKAAADVDEFDDETADDDDSAEVAAPAKRSPKKKADAAQKFSKEDILSGGLGVASRDATVAQLVHIVRVTDLMDDGEMLPPTVDTFNRLETGVLKFILNALTATNVPKKSGSEILLNGTPAVVGSDVRRKN